MRKYKSENRGKVQKKGPQNTSMSLPMKTTYEEEFISIKKKLGIPITADYWDCIDAGKKNDQGRQEANRYN